MLTCRKCQHISPDGSVFCDHCGTDMLPRTPMHGPVTPNRLRSQIPTPPQLRRAEATPATAIPTYPPLAGLPSAAALPEETSPHPPTRVRLRLTEGKTFELSGKSSYLIGRRDVNARIFPDVDLGDWNGAASGVSRCHALIHVNSSGVFVEDLESLNETHRNGYRLLAKQRYPLADGDELRLGAKTLLIVIS